MFVAIDQVLREVVPLVEASVGVHEGSGLEIALGIEEQRAGDPAEWAIIGRREADLLTRHLDRKILTLAGLKSQAQEAAREVHRVGEINIAPVLLDEVGVRRDLTQ